MSNPGTPFGFVEAGRLDGAPVNAGLVTGYCAYNASALGHGDVVTITNGLIAPASVTGGGATIAGIFISASWISIVEGKRVWKSFYPGNDSVNNANVEVKLIGDPFAIFETMCATGPVTQASVGKFANFAIGAGGATTTGGWWKSTYVLDDSTINATPGNLPFRIVYIEQLPKSDPTSANNLIRVQAVNLNQGV